MGSSALTRNGGGATMERPKTCTRQRKPPSKPRLLRLLSRYGRDTTYAFLLREADWPTGLSTREPGKGRRPSRPAAYSPLEFSNPDRRVFPMAWRPGPVERRWAHPAVASERPALTWPYFRPPGSSCRSEGALWCLLNRS